MRLLEPITGYPNAPEGLARLDRGAQPVAAAPVDPATQRIEQLKQLGELKAQGVLTEAEFQEQKRRIIG